MAAVTKITLIKQFTYRDDPNEEFGSTYHFKNNPPGDPPSWATLVSDLMVREQKIYTSDVHYVRAYGYNDDADNAHHVYSIEWPVGTWAGTMPNNSGAVRRMAGNEAAVTQWKTDRLSARGKPIWLRKYIHHGYVSTVDFDKLDVSYVAVLDTYRGATGVGGLYGGLRSPKVNDTVLSSEVIPWVTTRTLKRRGKRPPPGA